MFRDLGDLEIGRNSGSRQACSGRRELGAEGDVNDRGQNLEKRL